MNPPILEVEEGQLASFYCSVTGDPTPATTWTKLGGTLSANAVVDGSRLTFYRPAFEDAGDYVCNGVNAFGSDSEIATLVITRGKRLWAAVDGASSIPRIKYRRVMTAKDRLHVKYSRR